MKIEIKHSGSKHDLKLIPEFPKEIAALTRLLGKPNPEKGTKNPPHWHIPVKGNKG
jgi:hypothetical protein